MVMETVKDEIGRAIKLLGLTPSQIRPLSHEHAEEVYYDALNRFVRSGDRRWWWEDFRSETVAVTFPNGDGWKYLGQIAPDPRQHVWFIVEDDQLPFYPVYDATTEAVSAVIGECYAFEYYLIDKGFKWLLCETHHNVVYGIGDEVEERLSKLPS